MISDKFQLVGVMGWPVMHSRSPALHNYFFTQYGLAGTYVPLAIKPDDLEPARRALAPLGFAGRCWPGHYAGGRTGPHKGHSVNHAASAA